MIQFTQEDAAMLSSFSANQMHMITDLVETINAAVELEHLTPIQAADVLDCLAARIRSRGPNHTFTLEGRFKPYVRMTQRSMHANPHARQYLASKIHLATQLKQQRIDRRLDLLPGQTPLAVHIDIQEANGFHNKDLDNQVKALLDAANGILYPDDRWIDHITASRRRTGQHLTHLAVAPMTVTPMTTAPIQGGKGRRV